MKNLVLVFMTAALLFACQSAQEKVSDAADAAADVAETAVDAAGDAANAMGDAAKDAVNAAGDAISGTYDDIKNALGTDAMKLDAANSSLEWTGGKVVGGDHTGTMNFKEGGLKIMDGKMSGVFTVDLSSMQNTDLPDAESKGKLIGHLASPDFFDVENNPTATLVFSDIEVGDGGAFSGTARLDLKGKSSYNNVVGNISDKGEGSGSIANVSMNFDRTEHDVKYGSGKFFDNLGDNVIKDQINLRGTLMFN